MRILFVAGMLLGLSNGAAFAQEMPADVHQHSTIPPTARFEIVQSELAAKWTFRLDRFTGHVAQLVRTTNDDPAWQEMEVVRLIPTQTASARPRFEIFASGLAAKHTFLIDTDTGVTWRLTHIHGTHADGSAYEDDIWDRFTSD